MHARAHTYIHIYLHLLAHIHTYIRTYILTLACTHTYIHTYILTLACTHTYIHTYILTLACTHTYMPVHAMTYMHVPHPTPYAHMLISYTCRLCVHAMTYMYTHPTSIFSWLYGLPPTRTRNPARACWHQHHHTSASAPTDPLPRSAQTPSKGTHTHHINARSKRCCGHNPGENSSDAKTIQTCNFDGFWIEDHTIRADQTVRSSIMILNKSKMYEGASSCLAKARQAHHLSPIVMSPMQN
jgi:hypothetical protein